MLRHFVARQAAYRRTMSCLIASPSPPDVYIRRHCTRCSRHDGSHLILYDMRAYYYDRFPASVSISGYGQLPTMPLTLTLLARSQLWYRRGWLPRDHTAYRRFAQPMRFMPAGR